MNDKAAPGGTQAVRRAIRLLKTLAASGQDVELAELTRKNGLARTTTHRLLSALESEGLVARSPGTGAYRLGAALVAMGARAARSHDLRELASPLLHELADETGETASLEIPAGGGMLVLEEVFGQHQLNVTAAVGTTWAMHATSTGKAYLSALPEDSWRSACGDDLEAFTSRTVVDPARLGAEIEQARRRGFALVIDELSEGFSAVGAAVIDAAGVPVGALSVGGPTPRLPRRRLGEMGRLVADAARRVSQQLGHR